MIELESKILVYGRNKYNNKYRIVGRGLKNTCILNNFNPLTLSLHWISRQSNIYMISGWKRGFKNISTFFFIFVNLLNNLFCYWRNIMHDYKIIYSI